MKAKRLSPGTPSSSQTQRRKKIARLKQKIADGKYRVENGELARALLTS